MGPFHKEIFDKVFKFFNHLKKLIGSQTCLEVRIWLKSVGKRNIASMCCLFGVHYFIIASTWFGRSQVVSRHLVICLCVGMHFIVWNGQASAHHFWQGAK
jgi:hypothetical protein